MFTQGQIIFTLFFIVAFALLLLYSYRKDLKLHQKYYKRSWLVLLGFLVFLSSLWLIKSFLY
ncbi:hypothetical protein FT993_04370 [Mesonia sp. HuA40]|nr:hypothetical protein [Mesonia sp. HuA40]TXK73555.1 hypothetical protein FT993_04370 [Mesonia sp. HuA40]